MTLSDDAHQCLSVACALTHTEEYAQVKAELAEWDLPWTRLTDYAREHPVNPTRLATGIPTLDQALDGGVPVGSLFTLQGAPHAGKTSFAVQLAVRWAKGMAADVYFCMPDEGALGAVARVGQSFGIDRRKLRAGDEAALAALAAAEETMSRCRIVDPDLDVVSVERVLASARKRQYGQEVPAVFVFDSTQTLRLEAEAEAERLRIGAIMDLLKKATRAWDCIVLNISHVNRAAYRNKRSEDNINPLAGGAESATIERQSDILVHLDGNITKVVTGSLHKNRPGEGQPTWHMRFDLPTATFREVDEEAGEAELAARKDQERQLAYEKLADSIEAALHADAAQGWNHAGLSGRQIEGLVGGKSVLVREALASMREAGRVVASPGPRNSIIWSLPAS